MAIVNQGAKNSLPSDQLPTGYTKPVVAGFSDYGYIKTVELLVLKATVEAASASATMTAIFNNATIGINKQIADIITADFVATKAVTSFGDLIALSDNADLTNTAVSYKCRVNIYVKSV